MSGSSEEKSAPVTYTCEIPLMFIPTVPLALSIATGTSIIIVGANGSGKTRLGAFIEQRLPDTVTQRIAAQKSLKLSDKISLVSYERAENSLRYGSTDDPPIHRTHHRWQRNPAVAFLDDFDALQQTLFAEQNKTAVEHLEARKSDFDCPIPSTKLGALKGIWDGLLPHRALDLKEASIGVRLTSAGSSAAGVYLGSEMSDGERAIFYFLGQCLVAPKNGVIIIDEPETHIHRATLGRLWSAAESSRPDCAFIYITHDLDFAAVHTASAKYFIRAYQAGDPERWDIEPLPDDAEIPSYVLTELVGSRRPILFVEGERASLDLMVYRSIYTSWTVIPIGSCENVIRSVCSYKNSSSLHNLSVRGLIDADDRSAEDVMKLNAAGVYVLPVAEIENLFALPKVFLALADALLCNDIETKIEELKTDIFCRAQKEADLVCSRYTLRRLDRQLKKVSVAAQDLPTLTANFTTELAGLDPAPIFLDVRSKLAAGIDAKDLPSVLGLYDNKGYVLSRVASRLGLAKANDLQDKLTRLLGVKNSAVRAALVSALPAFVE